MSEPITVQLVVDTPRRIAGVEHARDLYNAAQPAVVTTDPETGETTSTPATPLTSEQYIMFVAVSAILSYARQKVEADFYDGLITKTDRDARLAEIAAGG